MRFQVDAFFQYHFMNAYEHMDDIVVDFVRVSDFGTAFRSHDLENRPATVATEGRLYRAVVTSARRALTLEERWPAPCEFPQVAPSVQGVIHRYGYLLSSRVGEPQTAIVKVDMASGATQATELGTDCFPSEPIFVPRGHSDCEDDGYLLSIAYDATLDSSFIAVLDASKPSNEPLSRVWFDHHIPRPLHGTWHGC